MYDGFSLVLESPSPKFQSHVVGDPVDVSVNCTVRGAVPDEVDAVNKATNGVVDTAAAVAGNVTVKVSVLPVPVPATAPIAGVPESTVGVRAVENW